MQRGRCPAGSARATDMKARSVTSGGRARKAVSCRRAPKRRLPACPAVVDLFHLGKTDAGAGLATVVAQLAVEGEALLVVDAG